MRFSFSPELKSQLSFLIFFSQLNPWLFFSLIHHLLFFFFFQQRELENCEDLRDGAGEMVETAEVIGSLRRSWKHG